MKSAIGIVGLGVMGKSLALNFLEKGITVSGFNRAAQGEEKLTEQFLLEAEAFSAQGYTDLKPFIESLSSPKVVFLMVKAGEVVDIMIDQIEPLLQPNDIIIDGGNSHFQDTIRRENELRAKGLSFFGCGVSGGEEGARKGPSIMPGGNHENYKSLQNLLETIAAKDKNGKACCTLVGPNGSGHFVKMIHNGIEYAEMQLLAEVYGLLRTSCSNDEIAKILEKWNEGPLGGFLLEITIDILRKKGKSGYLIDEILDKAGNKGTGSWSSQMAMQMGMPTTMMTDAVFARYISSFKEERVRMAAQLQKPASPGALDTEQLKNAYQLARIINHHQGFSLIQKASDEYNWSINFSEVARIWTNGCIIRSKLMQELSEMEGTFTTLKTPSVQDQSTSLLDSLTKTVSHATENRIPTPTLSSALQFWLGITSADSPANLIQAQRDYFGAHTYQRIDDPNGPAIHTNWKE